MLDLISVSDPKEKFTAVGKVVKASEKSKKCIQWGLNPCSRL
jgi:hypothetical protein